MILFRRRVEATPRTLRNSADGRRLRALIQDPGDALTAVPAIIIVGDFLQPVAESFRMHPIHFAPADAVRWPGCGHRVGTRMPATLVI